MNDFQVTRLLGGNIFQAFTQDHEHLKGIL
jgi:hypothetical protein